MTTMADRIEERKQLEDRVEEITSVQNGMVQRVLRVFERVEKDLFTGPYYDTQGPRYVLLQSWNWPQVFETFEIESDENKLYAGGMYSGSRGYYEHETVRFPMAWLAASDEQLDALIRDAWKEHNRKEEHRLDLIRQAQEQKERQELARLKEKYDGTA